MTLQVLQIAHDHPAHTAGGTEFLAHDLTAALNAAGGVRARFLAATTSLQRPDDAPGSLGIEGGDHLLRTGRYDRFSMLRQDGTDWVASMGRLLDSFRPDVVHLHGLDRIGAEVLAVIRRLAPRTRIVMTLHDYQILCPNDGLMLTVPDGMRCQKAGPERCRGCYPAMPAAAHLLRKAHLTALLALVDAFIAPSRFLAERFVEWGIEASRITVLPNQVQAAPQPPRGSRARPDRLAFFGNIAPHKGVLPLLAAARMAGDRVTLDLHGGLGHAEDGFRRAFAGALAAAPNAHHHGPYARADLPALMARADWVVMPSIWWENAPLVLLEARAAGLPVICSGIGGMAEMVEHGVTGLHVPPGDPRPLAETMRAAAADRAGQARMAAAQRARHGKDAYRGFVHSHLDLYRTLTGRIGA
ncbi:glycosyltransferase family 4 protein [Paracoccus sp. WLY502]|uniref:glycosyltransferase family 4 protein n=1 Tax=Paracoccus yibinensis TaxID=3068891 RepID=UPI0027964680|nr:glycosyltransferase family 4 protein [Paracoccus sp. WLY502]MDQ1900560.1 glycosyltransferase family 4 protein [Paracoccus sp. WLY502]